MYFMLSSSRFVVAVHALSVMAKQPARSPVCSNTIARSVHTNPVVIRRLMCSLEKAGLVQSVSGRSGGFVLSQAAGTISLADIYRAVEDEAVFRMHKTNENCPVAIQMAECLVPFLKSAERAMARSLSETSLAQIVMSIN
jgi:Rrf2 family protein